MRPASSIKNHLITANVNKYPDEVKKHAESLRGRSMLVKKAEPVLFECVVRGYLEGFRLERISEKRNSLRT